MRASTVLSYVLLPLLILLIGWRIAVFSAVILSAIYAVGVRISVGVFKPKPKRVSLREGFRVQAAVTSFAELEGRILLSLAFGAVVGFLAFGSTENRLIAVGILGIVFLLAAIPFQMLRTKKMLDRTGIDPMNNSTPANPRLQPTGHSSAGG